MLTIERYFVRADRCLQDLLYVARENEIEIEEIFGHVKGKTNIQGEYFPEYQLIVLYYDEHCSLDELLDTLAHELGHGLDVKLDTDGYGTDKAEAFAEWFAYLFIQHYIPIKDKPDRSIKPVAVRVRKLVTQLLDKVDEDLN